jgi:copper(I)-binding protein
VTGHTLFLTVENKWGVPVQLRGGETAVAAAAQLVRFRMQGPYLRTWLVDPVVIGPHERYAFEPGAVALELRKLHKELRRGDVIPVTLGFSGIGGSKWMPRSIPVLRLLSAAVAHSDARSQGPLSASCIGSRRA